MIRAAVAALPCAALLFGASAAAQDVPDLPPADIYVLGERHDNPDHHRVQAALVARIAPTAIAFEMLAPLQAAAIGPRTPRDETLGDRLAWADSGWPDFAMYLPIFQAAEAPVVGAGGDDVRDLSAFALDTPLPGDQQAAREALQMAAHCDALPPDILPGFVARQRETDARLARATLDALADYGPPVVLIAGNGHARTDWGVPAMIALAAPDVSVVSLIQSEDGREEAMPGTATADAPAPERADPCAAFR